MVCTSLGGVQASIRGFVADLGELPSFPPSGGITSSFLDKAKKSELSDYTDKYNYTEITCQALF
jgi:hypothetical protein